MDLATFIGIVGGFTLMLAALLLAGSQGGRILTITQFIDPPAAMLVFGGALCVVLTSTPLRVVLQLPKILLKLFVNQNENLPDLVNELVRLSEVARREGLLALEDQLQGVRNKALLMGVQMAIDGARPEVIREIMHAEMNAVESRHYVGKRMFETMGRCGPAFGMISTLLGLILMLGNLDNPDSIGPSMALALVGTLYGAAMANLICIPCAEKLSFLSRQEQLAKQIILHGVMAIQAGDNPRIVAQKLNTYLPPPLQTRAKAA
ncbi:MAG TPA: MotA/TolQ/ExbB proton channel family protein [Pirellulales bacterium]|nr:MotA/TolQ/ExbB proton channel family protein [Pirellulales bacterium]